MAQTSCNSPCIYNNNGKCTALSSLNGLIEYCTTGRITEKEWKKQQKEIEES